jgi:hypothetical protein
MAEAFAVSKQAPAIRLETIGVIKTVDSASLPGL